MCWPLPVSAGELLEYVTSELNVHEVECCADPLQYATLRADPDFQVRREGGGHDGPAIGGSCPLLAVPNATTDQRVWWGRAREEV